MRQQHLNERQGCFLALKQQVPFCPRHLFSGRRETMNPWVVGAPVVVDVWVMPWTNQADLMLQCQLAYMVTTPRVPHLPTNSRLHRRHHRRASSAACPRGCCPAVLWLLSAWLLSVWRFVSANVPSAFPGRFQQHATKEMTRRWIRRG